MLEGLLTVPLGEEIRIIELLESESNQTDKEDKFNILYFDLGKGNEKLKFAV